jgi:lipid-binding SYLF domain-containing protein
MKLHALVIAAAAGLPFVLTAGCSTAPETHAEQQNLDSSAVSSLRLAMDADPTLRPVLDRAAGYAVFPAAGEGGLIVGGGYGRGALFEHGQISGYCDMTSGSVGAKIGGQKFSEIIAFQTPETLNKFKNGEFTVSADASAVAIKSGAAANAQFKDNVAVFVYDQKGLMADASVGGQSFRFTPLSTAQQAAGTVNYDQNQGSSSGQQINTNTSSGSDINNQGGTTIGK